MGIGANRLVIGHNPACNERYSEWIACYPLGIDVMLSDWGMVGKTCSKGGLTDLVYLTFNYYEGMGPETDKTFNWKIHTRNKDGWKVRDLRESWPDEDIDLMMVTGENENTQRDSREFASLLLNDQTEKQQSTRETEAEKKARLDLLVAIV